MVSYWKTQWVNVALGLLNLGIAIWSFCVGNDLCGIGWCLTATIWFLTADINYNAERIRLLEAQAKKYDAMLELVHELRNANIIDRERMDIMSKKINKLTNKDTKEN